LYLASMRITYFNELRVIPHFHRRSEYKRT
jgi:hypothetical protein